MKFSIQIATKNRREDLIFTLNKIRHLFNEKLNCVVYDDGSTDGTFEAIRDIFPEIQLLRNKKSIGYIACRNRMLNAIKSDFTISLDDDAHFLTENPIPIIEKHFEQNPKCGLVAARIFWSTAALGNPSTTENPQIVKGYVGCGHIWRTAAWKTVPNYPEWFEFYGEENFASLQLFKQNWEVHYLPEVSIQHRVDLKERAKNSTQFTFRYRRALRADWFNYFLFYPHSKIPRKIVYSIWMQFKNKIFKGEVKIIGPLFLAFWDVVFAVPNIKKCQNRLSEKEYESFMKLKDTKIYSNFEK